VVPQGGDHRGAGGRGFGKRQRSRDEVRWASEWWVYRLPERWVSQLHALEQRVRGDQQIAVSPFTHRTT